MNPAFLHPFLIIFLSGFMLFSSRAKIFWFNLIAILVPIIAMFGLYFLPHSLELDFFSLKLLVVGSWQNKLISLAFIFVLLMGNLSAIGHKKRLDVVWGSFYAAFSVAAVLSGDFISLFVNLELMAVVSAIIIFIGEKKSSLRAAKKYFLTHLASGNMILLGIIYIFNLTGSFELVSLTPLFNNPETSKLALTIMLIGMQINIAAFPFTGWMANYYPTASTPGFVYLISYTTKLSIFLFIKLLPGYFILKYVALVMIIYCALKLAVEHEPLHMLCYFSILSMGFMLLAVSYSQADNIHLTVYYLFTSILYNLLLTLVFGYLVENTRPPAAYQRMVILGFVVGMAGTLALPGTVMFALKSEISHLFVADLFSYISVMLISFSIGLSIFNREFVNKFIHTEYQPIDKCRKIALLMTLAVNCLILLMGNKLFQVKTHIGMMDIFKQLAIIGVSALCGFLIKYPRYITKPIAVVELIGDLIFYFHEYQDAGKQKVREPWSIDNAEFQVKRFFKIFHTQKVAIMVVFAMLSMGLLFLQKSFHFAL